MPITLNGKPLEQHLVHLARPRSPLQGLRSGRLLRILQEVVRPGWTGNTRQLHALVWARDNTYTAASIRNAAKQLVAAGDLTQEVVGSRIGNRGRTSIWTSTAKPPAEVFGGSEIPLLGVM